ncbi:hypothetical protein HK405_013035, partial [Cladochytrium tenue]
KFLTDQGLDETNTLFVICGDWDLKVMLPKQHAVSSLGAPPAVMQTWCNIKNAFQAFYNRPHMLGMAGMLKASDMPLVGRHHSGIDDARNIAAIARRMINDGYVFRPTFPALPGAAVVASQPRRQKGRQPNGPLLLAAEVAADAAAASSSAASSSAASTAPQATVAGAGAGSTAKVNGKGSTTAGPRLPAVPRLGALVDIGANMAHKSFSRGEADAMGVLAVLARARAAGVEHVVVTGTSIKSSWHAVRLCRHVNGRPGAKEKYPSLTCTAGVHPHDAQEAMRDEEHFEQELARLLAPENRDVVVAVGECGLDYDRNFSPAEDQLSAFALQCRAARRAGLPLFLHERAAHEDFCRIFEVEFLGGGGAATGGEGGGDAGRGHHGVLHCYTGEDEAHLSRVLGLGLSVGVTGWVTDERPGRGSGLARVVPRIPSDRLMVETDAPFLAPRSVRPLPRINEPSLLGLVAEAVARLRGTEPAALAAETTANAVAMFRLTEHGRFFPGSAVGTQ